MPVGTVLRIGNPANGAIWVKLPLGWSTNHGRWISHADAFDTLEHGAFETLAGGIK